MQDSGPVMHDSNGDVRAIHTKRRSGLLSLREQASDEIGREARLERRVSALEDALAVAQAAIAHCKGLAEAAAAAASSALHQSPHTSAASHGQETRASVRLIDPRSGVVTDLQPYAQGLRYP